MQNLVILLGSPALSCRSSSLLVLSCPLSSMMFPWESGKKTQLDGSGILWEHTGTRATTSQHPTWRSTTSCLAQGQECTHCHILFSTHHNGRDQARASLRLCVKCPRDSWSLTIPPCIFLWATVCCGGTAMPASHHRCFTNPILSHLSKLNYLLEAKLVKTPINPILWLCLWICDCCLITTSPHNNCYNSDRFCVLEWMHKS